MKRFNKLETGIWTHIDKKGHVHVFSQEEFIRLNRLQSWWSNVKDKYFKL
jgi:hypothetical protein